MYSQICTFTCKIDIEDFEKMNRITILHEE